MRPVLIRREVSMGKGIEQSHIPYEGRVKSFGGLDIQTHMPDTETAQSEQKHLMRMFRTGINPLHKLLNESGLLLELVFDHDILDILEHT